MFSIDIPCWLVVTGTWLVFFQKYWKFHHPNISQLTSSYLSEVWLNHEPAWTYVISKAVLWTISLKESSCLILLSYWYIRYIITGWSSIYPSTYPFTYRAKIFTYVYIYIYIYIVIPRYLYIYICSLYISYITMYTSIEPWHVHKYTSG